MEQICKNCSLCKQDGPFVLCLKHEFVTRTAEDTTCEHFDEKETVKKEDVYL